GAGTGGLDLWIGADLPAEAGVSSSAALTVATVLAAAALNGRAVPPLGLVPFARLVQRVENRAGTRCGVMDPLIVLGGVRDAALLIDCRTFIATGIAIPPGLALVVCDSGVQRALADSAYNVRRAECEAALELLREALGRAFRALRDVTAEDLDSAGDALPELLKRRARHVVSENERVLAATDALATADRSRLGALLAAAHTSLRDDYEVSAPELDALVAFAVGADGCWGSCMTGAGFGGATVSLVEADRVEAFSARVAVGYAERFGRAPAIFASPAAAGARRLQ
ncbi:MAG: galactokinase, partial [Gemmatimonadota bacterium]